MYLCIILRNYESMHTILFKQTDAMEEKKIIYPRTLSPETSLQVNTNMAAELAIRRSIFPG